MRIIFLHGFGGAPDDGGPLLSALAGPGVQTEALSIPGHRPELPLDWLGISDWETCVAYLARKIHKGGGEAPLLIGYSMGARLALALSEALELSGLVLLSGGLGSADARENEVRRELDRTRAAQLRKDPESFWREWYQQPLFASPWERKGAEAWEKWLERKKAHDHRALADSLECLSPAAHGSLEPLFRELKTPTLVFVGELDKKYAALAEYQGTINARAQVEKIAGVGHILPWEAPTLCAARIQAWRNDHGN